jgi:hypothetical protein
MVNDKPFEGHIQDDQFQVVENRPKYTMVHPHLHGTLIPTESGTRVEVKFNLALHLIIFFHIVAPVLITIILRNVFGGEHIVWILLFVVFLLPPSSYEKTGC